MEFKPRKFAWSRLSRRATTHRYLDASPRVHFAGPLLPPNGPAFLYFKLDRLSEDSGIQIFAGHDQLRANRWRRKSEAPRIGVKHRHVRYVPKADIRIDRQIYGHASNVPACEPCDSTITPGAGPLANATALRANTSARRRSGFELPVSIRQPRGFKIRRNRRLVACVDADRRQFWARLRHCRHPQYRPRHLPRCLKPDAICL